MINDSPEQAPAAGKRPLGRRLAVAGVLTAAVLAGGAGVAYATGTGSAPVESGYATVIDGEPRTSGAYDGDCPDRGSGGAAEGGSESPSETPDQSPEQTPEQNPTPEGDI